MLLPEAEFLVLPFRIQTFQTEIVNFSRAGKGHIRVPFSFLICLFAEDYPGKGQLC